MKQDLLRACEYDSSVKILKRGQPCGDSSRRPVQHRLLKHAYHLASLDFYGVI